MTYVDARGDLQTVNDPTELRAASGAFGLLGIVVSVTLQLDTMGVVDMMPVKQPVMLAIPPPKDYPVKLGDLKPPPSPVSSYMTAPDETPQPELHVQPPLATSGNLLSRKIIPTRSLSPVE